MHLHDHHHRSGLEEVLEDAHTAIALLAGTVVASPVLLAALAGRQAVATAAALYLAAIVGAWVAVGLLAGALSAAGHRAARASDATAGDGPTGGATDAAPTSDVARDPDPAPATR